MNATAVLDPPKVKAEKPSASPVVPIKVGFFGGQGSGKTTSAALLAAALSKEVYGGAPVFVLDTEPGWQFLKRRVFDVEGIEMIQRTEPTFKAMIASIREAEKLGCCVWAVDSLTIIWQELMQSFQARNHGEIPINVWGDIKQMWADYTTAFLNSKMSCFALGRLGNEMSEIEDDKKPGRTKLVKTGTKFKAGGGESFGYEPHLLLELSLEKKAKRKAGVELEGEGRMIHRVDVLKDRTWALNGKVIRWSDKGSYQKRGYATVWDSVLPHYREVQATMALVKIETGASSQSLISDDGNSEYYQQRQRRDVLVAELSATLDILWGGQGKEEKRMRRLVGEAIFGALTQEAWEKMSLEKIERGTHIVQAFRKRSAADGLPETEAGTLNALQLDIDAHDQGTAEKSDLPF